MKTALTGRDHERIHDHLRRYRGLLEACVEYHGERTFTDAEIDAEVEERHEILVGRVKRGLPLIEAHE